MYPLNDEDIVPGEWSHSRATCAAHGETGFALDLRRLSETVRRRCIQCMRNEQVPTQTQIKTESGPMRQENVLLKPTNPKDQAAGDRAQLLPPLPALVEEGLAFFEGVLKYGAHNYTIKGVRASVYAFATARHLAKWYFGQDRDAVTNVHHLGNARACLGVLLDAEHRGKLEDDRPPALPDIDALFAHATTVMQGLISLYGGTTPRHYTIADTEEK